jgi:hypothetical protein
MGDGACQFRQSFKELGSGKEIEVKEVKKNGLFRGRFSFVYVK